ncbi:hypothetical protein ACO1O0_001883 [Amphichorda felina]
MGQPRPDEPRQAFSKSGTQAKEDFPLTRKEAVTIAGVESPRHHHSSHKHRHRERSEPAAADVSLPFSARALKKGDLPMFRPLFAYFLSLQKQIELEDLDEREVKGRWKSFIGKWNRGELAEGWYDPDMFSRIAEWEPESRPRSPEPPSRRDVRGEEHEPPVNDSDDDDYGPVLPGSAAESARRAGPGIPSLQDLSVRNEMLEEDREEDRHALRAARKADRAIQKERLDDILPRADAGTRERKLEKRQMVNDKMREFRDKSPGGVEGATEGELMGGGDSLEEYKRAKQREQRKKSEREIRREEIERAKREEIEEKRRAWREREEGTVSMLREIARQRFG